MPKDKQTKTKNKNKKQKNKKKKNTLHGIWYLECITLPILIIV
jgi:hypothetical protein